MVKQIHLIFIVFSLLLHSCAQQGTISGGTDDKIAPRVKPNGMNPPNGSLNFQSKQIRIDFDEFIQLNNPIETISITPNDAKIKATVQKKSVILDLDGTLKPNTTYSITLNAAIRDFTANNDSLMQYVFSTGSYIDSLTYEISVVDALKNTPVSNVVVGLFQLGDSSLYQKPRYYTKTTATGLATFNYLTSGEFTVVAFDDQNKDLRIQANEKVGFLADKIQLDSARVDTIPIRFYSPPLPPKIRSKSFVGPSLIKLGATFNLDTTSIWVNGDKLNTTRFIYSSDSIGFLIDNQLEVQEIVVQHAKKLDTLKIRTPERERNRAPSLESNLNSGSLIELDTLILTFSDAIESIDSSRFKLINSDSLELKIKYVFFQDNKLKLILEKTENNKLILNLLENSIYFKNYKEKFVQTIELNIKKERDFGRVLIKNNDEFKAVVFELKKGDKIVRTFSLDFNESITTVYNLEAAGYSLVGFVDENKNGKWDIGSLHEGIQPEKRLFFPNEIKVRANWDIEVELEP
jgi:uncharacterized protein (DUF2141 family)